MEHQNKNDGTVLMAILSEIEIIIMQAICRSLTITNGKMGSEAKIILPLTQLINSVGLQC